MTSFFFYRKYQIQLFGAGLLHNFIKHNSRRGGIGPPAAAVAAELPSMTAGGRPNGRRTGVLR